MNSRTYYDILGVSREATLQEITSAKNALAKVYHPDANMNQGIDTTACMQEILEAYWAVPKRTSFPSMLPALWSIPISIPARI